MPKRSRIPPHPDQLGKAFVDFATRQREPDLDPRVKDPAAVDLGRRGGLVGGKARAASLTPEQRTESARKAAMARWAKASS
jgi:hypothetical protein